MTVEATLIILGAIARALQAVQRAASSTAI